MDDRKTEDTTPAAPPQGPKVPDPPPFDPDPNLIGDMERSERPGTETR